MTKRTILGAWAGVAMLALAGPVLAQSAGQSSGTTPAATNSNSAMPMPHGIVPSRSELPMSAFNKLDNNNKGYVTRDDVQQLSGFESAFGQADQNRDGRLNASEFNSAWAIYTGQNP